MDTNLSKIRFLGAILLWCFLSFVNASNIFASANTQKEEKKFGDWKVICSKNKDGKKEKCYAENIVTTKKDDKEVIIATYKIETNTNKDFKLIQILPLGTNLQSGTAVIADSRMVAPGKFVYCLNEGCIALAEMQKADLDIILASNSAAVGILSAEGGQANIPFSSTGLKDAIEELKSHKN